MFKDFLKRYKSHIITGLPIFIACFVLTALLNNIIILLIGQNSSNEVGNITILKTIPISASFFMVFVAPFYEEILFRLNLKALFKKKYTYVIISGLIFGLMHLVSATESLELLYIFPYWLMGSCLSLIFYKTNNVFSSLFYHSLNNLIVITIYFSSGGLL